MLCDGSAVGRSVYPDLFALIGTTYGEGDGIDTFNLPNLSDNRFVEGASTAGTAKAAGLPNIEGEFNCRNLRQDSFISANGAFSHKSDGETGIGTNASSYGTIVGFDASDSNPIYGNSQTVQPKSLTVRYIIKAFNGILSGREMIDITQMANEVNKKFGDHELYEENFTIIYPNGGTEENPANVTINSRYVMENPFPGYHVYCIAELFANNEWNHTNWASMIGGDKGNYSYGVSISQHNENQIKILTGKTLVLVNSTETVYYEGNTTSNLTTHLQSAPCRVKVWKIGKINS